jgi:hypothetical protein
VVPHDADWQKRLAAEVRTLPADSHLRAVVTEWANGRAQSRACASK